VDLRAGLDDLQKRKFFTLPGLELRPLGRPARSYAEYAIPAPHFVLYKFYYNLRFGALTAVTMRRTIFYNAMPSSLLVH
jgi:hypothetical protein